MSNKWKLDVIERILNRADALSSSIEELAAAAKSERSDYLRGVIDGAELIYRVSHDEVMRAESPSAESTPEHER